MKPGETQIRFVVRGEPRHILACFRSTLISVRATRAEITIRKTRRKKNDWSDNYYSLGPITASERNLVDRSLSRCAPSMAPIEIAAASKLIDTLFGWLSGKPTPNLDQAISFAEIEVESFGEAGTAMTEVENVSPHIVSMIQFIPYCLHGRPLRSAPCSIEQLATADTSVARDNVHRFSRGLGPQHVARVLDFLQQAAAIFRKKYELSKCKDVDGRVKPGH